MTDDLTTPAPETISRLGRRVVIARWLKTLAWHWVAIVGLSLGAAAAFAAVGEDVVNHEAGTLDGAVRDWTLGHQTPVLSFVFTWITRIGSTIPMLVLVAAVGLWLWHRKHRRIAAVVVTAPAIAVGLFNGIKAIVRRARPLGATKLHVLTYSFPSGHATVSAAVMLTLAYVLARERMVPRRAAIPAALVWPVLVGASRVYLDVHWASDVLGGWALGTLVAALSAAVYERVHTRVAPLVAPGAGAAAERSGGSAVVR